MGKIELMTRDIEKSFKGLSRLAVVSVVMSLAFATVVGVAALVYAEKRGRRSMCWIRASLCCWLCRRML